jgi:hypothetical protein
MHHIVIVLVQGRDIQPVHIHALVVVLVLVALGEVWLLQLVVEVVSRSRLVDGPETELVGRGADGGSEGVVVGLLLAV